MDNLHYVSTYSTIGAGYNAVCSYFIYYKKIIVYRIVPSMNI